MSEFEPIRQPIILNPNEARTKEILLLQPTYLLDENNFNKLIKGSSGCKDWAQKFLFMSLGWIFKIVSAFIAFLIAFNASKNKENIEIEVKSWEYISVGLGLFVCIVLYIIGCFVKNERDKLIESIKNHFRKS
ncbi:MAG: hypothetical protein Q8909_02325 [Bacteroidota bacterium]|nr:hypothetical protein [Bacteroidota bacterium]